LKTKMGTEKQFISDADLIMWMDVNQVLYAEGLLPKWKQEQLESLPEFNWDVSHITPAFRALVIREQCTHLAEFTAENPAVISRIRKALKS
jgi:hypothetical protein